jgi:hypothetical protein
LLRTEDCLLGSEWDVCREMQYQERGLKGHRSAKITTKVYRDFKMDEIQG